jgi:DNA-binding response OmpR family regulator
MLLSSPPSRHLLLVEDDRMVRETVVLMLENDYEIHIAASAGCALARLRAADQPAIDVMLLDCLLPDGNLHDVLAEADRQSVAVVLVSGDPRQAEAIDPGRSFLAKPFTQATLLAILDSASGAAG